MGSLIIVRIVSRQTDRLTVHFSPYKTSILRENEGTERDTEGH